jgi:ribosomal-protein-alanine N-acetyltransferase
LPPQAELETIAVASQNQRQGLGRLLFDALSLELHKEGVAEVVLEVRASNRAAMAFYRSAGFGQKGIRRSYYVDPVEDAVVMGLRLI